MFVTRVVYHFDFFFFFKQKTAYEMRISDWSSDVCSSDLQFTRGAAPGVTRLAAAVQKNDRGLCRIATHVRLDLDASGNRIPSNFRADLHVLANGALFVMRSRVE